LQSFSYLFLYPVDTTFPEQANYYDVIKHPMDLSTVKVGHVHVSMIGFIANSQPAKSIQIYGKYGQFGFYSYETLEIC